MALVMQFQDDCGTQHANSCWEPKIVSIGTIERAVRVTFLAYKDQQSHNNGKAPLVGGRHEYVIMGDEYNYWSNSLPVGDKLKAVVENACEEFALWKKDTPTGQVDEDGEPILESFFKGATRT